MRHARELHRGHKRLRPLIEYALSEGWEVSRTAGGHLKFVKSGMPPIYTSSTTSDQRSVLNARARLSRAGSTLETEEPEGE